MFFNEPKTLIVVYKDEMLVNQIKKLVETNDDENDDAPIGTKDGSVRIVAWDEKMWLQQKKAGNINSKVLFVGDIKGTDKLIPIIDEKFSDCGVKYGWAGNQAIIHINSQALKRREDYDAFLEKLKALPVPKQLKKKPEHLKEITPQKGALAVGLAVVLGFWGNMAIVANDVFTDKAMIKQQMLFYGIINLYNNHLDQFIQA